jgi:magnesium chelatase subunit D
MTGTAAAQGEDAWARARFAAALFAVNPLLSGVSLRAAPGPARDAWLALLRDYLPADAPMRRSPPNIADDRLLGGLDLAATLRAGRPIAEMGLIAQTHGGVLVLAMAERLSSATAARFAAALDEERFEPERQGGAARQAYRVGIVALDEGYEPEERPPAALLDRLAIHLDLAGLRPCPGAKPEPSSQEIAAARMRLTDVETPADVIKALVAGAARLGVLSLRAPLLALRVARAACALRGASVVDDSDLEIAARLVLAPRATCLPAPVDETETETQRDESVTDPGEPKNDNHGIDQRALEEMVVAAARASLPVDLLARLEAGDLSRTPAPRGGHSGKARVSAHRGRPLNVRRGGLREGRLSLIDTLRAAAPWQPLRRADFPEATPRALHLRAEDFRIRRFREQRGSTTIFVVDASGSSAMQRLAEVKGAIELLLADCYVRRDSVALIVFRGKQAEIALPPTRALARARRLLAAMPGGGGTPLAQALDAAAELADSVRRKGQTPLVVLLTDGKANIDRAGAPGRAGAFEDALLAARGLGGAGYAALAIDSASGVARPDTPTRRIAEAMRARYLRLPYVDASRLSQAVRAATVTT